MLLYVKQADYGVYSIYYIDLPELSNQPEDVLHVYTYQFLHVVKNIACINYTVFLLFKIVSPQFLWCTQLKKDPSFPEQFSFWVPYPPLDACCTPLLIDFYDSKRNSKVLLKCKH